MAWHPSVHLIRRVWSLLWPSVRLAGAGQRRLAQPLLMCIGMLAMQIKGTQLSPLLQDELQ